MIHTIHNCFTKTIMDNIGAPKEYVPWGTAPDIDLTSWHRYRRHKISSFRKLYLEYIVEKDIRNAFDTKIVSVALLGHLYLDAISGPVKVFDGMNVTINHKLLDHIDNSGYTNTINNIHKIITHPSKEYIEAVCAEFTKLPKYSREIYYVLFWNRLEESTLGTFKPTYHPLSQPAEDEYLQARDEFLLFEDRLIEIMSNY